MSAQKANRKRDPSSLKLEVDIDVRESAWRQEIDDIEQFTRTLIETTLKVSIRGGALKDAMGTTVDECSVVYANDAFARQLNRDYRGKDKATNVLSFPNSFNQVASERRVWGDIVIALETTINEAKQQGKQVAHHAGHLLVHGMLHLLGQNHENQREAEQMESLEVCTLKRLSINNPYE